MATADCCWAQSKPALPKKSSADAILRSIAKVRRTPERALKTERRLITHGNAIEHITGRRPAVAEVSVATFIPTAKRFRVKDPHRNRRGEGPFGISFRGQAKSGLLTGSHITRWRLLINPY